MNQLAIDQLPYLCLREIFSYFGLRDVARCRLVCRLFKFYADLVAVRELVVYTPCNDRKSHWYLTDRQIEYKDEINPQEFASLRKSHQLRQQLNFLRIHVLEGAHFEYLNDFDQLIHLEIGYWQGTVHSPLVCTLPNLRVLNLGWINPRLVLKTPRLEVLKSVCVEDLDFEYPETIKRLECDETRRKKMAALKNLEVFSCVADGDAFYRVRHCWMRLKELDLRFTDWSYFGKRKYEAFRRVFTSCLGTITESGAELKINFEDVRLVEVGQLEDFNFMNTYGFYMKNYKWITGDRRLRLRCINYGDLMDLVQELSSDFFERFPSIRTVQVTRLVDPNQLAWFLKHTRNPPTLIVSSTLGEQFLSNLANINDRLMHLKIIEGHPNAISNFDFLLQFRSLCSFVTDLPIERAFDLAENLFKQTVVFGRFEWKAPWNERIVIRRDPSAEDRFELTFLEDKTIKSCLTKRKWISLPGHYEKRKARYGYGPPTRSSNRINKIKHYD